MNISAKMIVWFALFLLVAGAAPIHADQASDEGAIKELGKKWEAAWNK